MELFRLHNFAANINVLTLQHRLPVVQTQLREIHMAWLRLWSSDFRLLVRRLAVEAGLWLVASASRRLRDDVGIRF